MSVIQITDLNDPQLDIYARLSEGQLLHYYEPDLGIFIAESPKVIQTAFEQGYEPISFLVEDRHIKTQAKDIILQYQDIPVYTASFDVLNKYFTISQMPIVSSTYWNNVHGNNKEEVVQDLEGMQTMYNLGKNMAWILKCIEIGKQNNINQPVNTTVKTNFIR